MKPSRDEIKQKLVAFITKKLGGAAVPVSEKTRVFSTGLLDSLAFMEIILFIEEEFGESLIDHGEVTFQSLDQVGDIINAIHGASNRA